MKLKIAERMEQFRAAVLETVCTNKEGVVITIEDALNELLNDIETMRERKKNLYIIGNGGSAATASHVVNDFLNVARISAHTLHDSSLLTCMANDYGYVNAFSNIVNRVTKTGDMLIAISSSGQSGNILTAVESAKKNNATVITLSGFSSENKLRRMGKWNYWIDSDDYGIVEIAHQFLLHNLSDRLASKID